MTKKSIIRLSLFIVILFLSSCDMKIEKQGIEPKNKTVNIEEVQENKNVPTTPASAITPSVSINPQNTALAIDKNAQNGTSNQDYIKPLVILKDKIHPSLPEFTFKIFVEKKENAIIANKIEVSITSEKEEKIQDITFRNARTLDEKQIGTFIEDMNFDGYKDIRVQCGTPPGPNIPFLYWLWDKDSAQYVQNEEFEELTSPGFDNVNKIITSFNRGSAVSSREREYKYINKKLILIKETERVAEPDKKVWHITTKELINNELVVTKKQDEPLN